MVANRVYIEAFTSPLNITINKVTGAISTSLGTSCTGGTCGFKASIWDATLTTKLVETTAYTSTSGYGVQQFSFASSYTLNANTAYYLVFASDFAMGFAALNNISYAINPGTYIRIGYCTNTLSGDGASIAFPSSCGVRTLLQTIPLFVLEP